MEAFVSGAVIGTQRRSHSARCSATRENGESLVSRRELLKLVAVAPLAFGAPQVLAEDDAGYSTTESGVQYKQIKKGTGKIKAKIGDLVGVRFTGSYNGRVFDDLFKTDQAFYIRVGNGSLLAGLEEILQMMYRGDRYKIILSGNLGFGPQGRKASPGKPSIPGNATLEYELELSDFPGSEEELLELSDEV
uniref:peptidylprolyl isomerase n=1 Tax=Rhodosorus marinus TaxID=101924 RepID=A0A7S0G4Y5_9RHOD|mmetsp:Transcript_3228/g.4638  ORF Transcript_3228/g.4638 Transcript_3228/m.4638 type:complete len:191 (+) Transcript_3228:10-582(+)